MGYVSWLLLVAQHGFSILYFAAVIYLQVYYKFMGGYIKALGKIFIRLVPYPVMLGFVNG